MTSRPLSGITVVSLEQAVAAPYATRLLADLGARVIKVERPGTGDFGRSYDETVRGESSYFVWLNRSKESITLDLKQRSGQDVLQRLLLKADVLVQNLAPGAAARLGLGAALENSHPRLIRCDISGYGNHGPWSGRKAYDLLVQAEAALPSITGTADEIAKAGISVADIAAGMFAQSGILAALYHRQATGEARAVEVALFEALTEWMGQPSYYSHYGGTPPARFGAEHATIAPYGPFTAGDGRVVMLAIQNEREWATFCRSFLASPQVATDPRFVRNSARVAHRGELNGLIANRFVELDAARAVALLDEIGIANARLNSLEELWEHPSLAGRDRWRTIETPVGPIEALLPPADLAGVEARMAPVPSLGAHTDGLLTELGYGPAEVATLKSAGAV